MSRTKEQNRIRMLFARADNKVINVPVMEYVYNELKRRGYNDRTSFEAMMAAEKAGDFSR